MINNIFLYFSLLFVAACVYIVSSILVGGILVTIFKGTKDDVLGFVWLGGFLPFVVMFFMYFC